MIHFHTFMQWKISLREEEQRSLKQDLAVIGHATYRNSLTQAKRGKEKPLSPEPNRKNGL